MMSAEIATALFTGVSAAALGAVAIFQLADRRKPRVFLYRFLAGPYWFVEVKCVRDPIESCTAFLDAKGLILKGTDQSPIYGQPLGLGESCLFMLPTPHVVDGRDHEEGTIIIRDAGRLLRRKKFKEIEIRDPNRPFVSVVS